MGWHSPFFTRGGTGRAFPATENTVEIAVERAIQASRGLESAIQLVFGVDPDQDLESHGSLMES